MELTLKNKPSITGLALSPDGKWMAVTQLWEEGAPGLTIWDTSSWKCVAEVDPGRTVHVLSASFNRHSNLLAYATSTHTVGIFDMKSMETKQKLDVDKVATVRYAKSKDLLLTTGNVVKVFDENNKAVFTYEGYKMDEGNDKPAVAVFYREDTSLIITGNNEDKLSVYDIASGKLTKQFPGGVVQANYMVTDPADKYLFLISHIPDANFLWKLDTMERALPQYLNENSYGASAVSLHPASVYYASGSIAGDVSFISIEKVEYLMSQQLHKGYVSALAFSVDGKLLISAGIDGRVVLTDIAGFIN